MKYTKEYIDNVGFDTWRTKMQSLEKSGEKYGNIPGKGMLQKNGGNPSVYNYSFLI